MTRKDYVKMADVIRRHAESSYAYGEKLTALAIARDMADIFDADNPAFDRDRFMVACGFPGNTLN